MEINKNSYFPLSLTAHFAIAPTAATNLKSKLLNNPKWSAENFNKGLDRCDDLKIKEIDLITAQCYRNFKTFKRDFSHKSVFQSIENFVLSELYKIIPNIYFGSPRNRNKFNRIVKRILSQSSGECVHLSLLFEDFQLGCIPWLLNEPDTEKSKKLLFSHILLMQTIVKPLINYCWYFERDIRTTEARLVPRRQIDSFCDRNFSLATRHGLLEKMDDVKEKDPLGKLLFIKKGKGNLDYRPVLWQSFRGKKEHYLKKKLSAVLKTYQIGEEQNLYRKWEAFVQFNVFKNSGRENMFYGLKLDLLDAFGLVELEELKTIIEGVDSKLLSMHDKEMLKRIIDQQYVVVRGKNIYEWKKGLLQGAQLSPLLCELYLSYTHHESFKHFNRPDSFMHRNTDDIFFVSTDNDAVIKFGSTASEVWDLNEKKTHQYLGPDQDDSDVIFCGKIFNLVTLQTSSAFEGGNGERVHVRNKFKIWNLENQYDTGQTLEFLRDFMRFETLNFYFSGFEVNTKYNMIDTVAKNIFDGMIFAAFKMFSAVESVNYLLKKRKGTDLIIEAIGNVVDQYSVKIRAFIMRYKGDCSDEDFFTVKVIKFISFKAFILVFKKSSRYWAVVQNMKYYVRRNLKVRKLPLVVDIKYFGLMPRCFQNYSTRRTSIFQNIIKND